MGRRRPWLALTAVALLFAAPPAAAAGKIVLPGIKGTDDRVLVEAEVYPWRAIGRVNKAVGGFCTGTLVGPRLVLTAAHCLWNPRTGRWLPPSSVHFVAGYQRGRYLAYSRIASFEMPGGYVHGAGADLAKDWALLTLKKDIGKAMGYLPVAALDSARLVEYRRTGGRFVQAGYSQDKAHILTRDDDCALLGFADGGRLVTHDCDATKGDSGSPILLRRGNLFFLVAMHVATMTQPTPMLGIAIPGSTFRRVLGQRAAE